MHYKRKGHRGRHKRNVMDNQGSRLAGNSVSKQTFFGRARPDMVHVSKSQRNKNPEEGWE